MLKKFLKEVVSIVVGKQAEDIIDMLDGDKYVNEFLIAKKLNLTINQTRNILYKISDHGLISSIRKKDKKKGWYTYFWKIEVMKSLEFLKRMIIKKMEQLNYQIKSRETKVFYVCEQCNIEFTEENALLNDFTCNECGKIFTRKDNSKLLRELRRELLKLEKKGSFLDEEIQKERKKLDKQKAKMIKKEEKEKVKKRAEAAAKRKAAKKAKDSVKKLESKTKSKSKPPKKKAKKKATKKKVAKKSAKKKSKKKLAKKAPKKRKPKTKTISKKKKTSKKKR